MFRFRFSFFYFVGVSLAVLFIPSGVFINLFPYRPPSFLLLVMIGFGAVWSLEPTAEERWQHDLHDDRGRLRVRASEGTADAAAAAGGGGFDCQTISFVGFLQLFPPLLATLGLPGTMGLLAMVCLVGAMLITGFLPETKGKPLLAATVPESEPSQRAN